MKQWVTNQDGLDSIKLEDAPLPDEAGLKDDEVLVKVNRVSLNYRDTEGMPSITCPLVFPNMDIKPVHSCHGFVRTP